MKRKKGIKIGLGGCCLFTVDLLTDWFQSVGRRGGLPGSSCLGGAAVGLSFPSSLSRCSVLVRLRFLGGGFSRSFRGARGGLRGVGPFSSTVFRGRVVLGGVSVWQPWFVGFFGQFRRRARPSAWSDVPLSLGPEEGIPRALV